jgi:hypothetical protein
MEKIKYYEKCPTKEVLRVDLDEFLKDRQQLFPGYVKVGKTIWHKIEERYDNNSRYEILSAEHIFAKCSSEVLALDIEKMCQQYMTEKGRLIVNSSGSDGGSRGNENKACAFYLTNHKENLYSCPIPRCLYTTSRDLVMQHMETHQVLIDSKKANALLNSLSSSHRLSVDPVPVSKS